MDSINGAARSLVMLAGNGGGVVIIVAMAALDDWTGPAPWALMGAAVVATIAFAAAAPETFPQQSAKV